MRDTQRQLGAAGADRGGLMLQGESGWRWDSRRKMWVHADGWMVQLLGDIYLRGRVVRRQGSVVFLENDDVGEPVGVEMTDVEWGAKQYDELEAAMTLPEVTNES